MGAKVVNFQVLFLICTCKGTFLNLVNFFSFYSFIKGAF